MNWLELFLTAVGLSMDAFAVAVARGLCMKRITFLKALIVGLYFGVFQALMPLLGFLLAARFADRIAAFDHWIAFVLLALIGLHMIKESLDHKPEECSVEEPSLKPRAMLPLALATSIDALAVGVTFAFLRVDIVPAVSFIGAVTLLLSGAGVFIGHAFGTKLKSKAEITGGVLLILIGVKIVLNHLGLLPF